MKPHIASLINALTLILLSLWAYFGASDPSTTALIPAFIGIALIILNPGLKKENKVIAHIAVILTVLVFIALFKPLLGAIERSSAVAIIRVSLMMLTTLLAVITFVQSFVKARKG